MKKLLIIISCAILFPMFASAQVISKETIRQELIALITQEIQELQNQINQILSSQNISSIQTQVPTQSITTSQNIKGYDSCVLNMFRNLPISQINESQTKDFITNTEFNCGFANGFCVANNNCDLPNTSSSNLFNWNINTEVCWTGDVCCNRGIHDCYIKLGN